MMTETNELFAPVQIGSLELKNRFVRSATCEAMADDDGGVTPGLTEILVALAQAKGNRKQAAGLLKVGRATLYRYLDHFDLQ